MRETGGRVVHAQYDIVWYSLSERVMRSYLSGRLTRAASYPPLVRWGGIAVDQKHIVISSIFFAHSLHSTPRDFSATGKTRITHRPSMRVDA